SRRHHRGLHPLSLRDRPSASSLSIVCGRGNRARQRGPVLPRYRGARNGTRKARGRGLAARRWGPPGPRGRLVKRAAPAICLVLLLGGCGLSMTEQRKYKTYSPSTLWADGASARPLPDGAVAEGDLTLAAIEATPPEASPALLARGRE